MIKRKLENIMLKASKVLFICFWQVQKYMQINICVFSLPRRKWYDDKHEKKEKENTRNNDLLRGFRSCRDPCRLISIWTERKHAVSKTAIWYSVPIRLVPIYIYTSQLLRFARYLRNRTPPSRVYAPHAPHTPPSPFLSYPLYKCRVNAHVTN